MACHGCGKKTRARLTPLAEPDPPAPAPPPIDPYADVDTPLILKDGAWVPAHGRRLSDAPEG